ncbi:MAG: exonuclease domain-containing protein [Gammaproteobacteria bacterium]
MQTYLFYDIETTGLNKAFDQILQFAAIRTDLELNEIERYELKIKLNPDVIPAPYALITHHIGIKDTLSGKSEIDAIKLIHGWINKPGTISLGYNTLGFDDEFLRFSFYRNLFAPYTHQYANQCSRMDIFPIAAMYYLFKPEVITWPKKEDGKISLKLEEINKANQLASGRAHDAMVDVEVTIALAKRFFAEREMWEYVTGYFNKQIDSARSSLAEGLMVYSKFGGEQLFQAPVLYLGNHRHYKNQQLWLRLDTENLNNPTPENLQDFKLVVNKKLGEPGFILPLNDRFLQHLTPSRRELAAANKQWLNENPEIFKQIVNYHSEFKFPVYPDTDAEASLYLNGFWSDEDNFFCRRFHTSIPQEKAIMTENLKNPTLKTLATRILGRHYPEAMTDKLIENFNTFTQRINPTDETLAMIDYRGSKRLTPKAALNEIYEIRNQNNATLEQTQLLNELEDYLKRF